MVGAGDRVVERAVEILGYEPSLIPDRSRRARRPGLQGLPARGPALPARRHRRRCTALDATDMSMSPPLPAGAAASGAGSARARGGAPRARGPCPRGGGAAALDLGLRSRCAALRGCRRPATRGGDVGGGGVVVRSGRDLRRARGLGRGGALLRAGRGHGRAGRSARGPGELLPRLALASESDDRARAIRLLQQVGPQDPEFGRANELLALAFEQEATSTWPLTSSPAGSNR